MRLPELETGEGDMGDGLKRAFAAAKATRPTETKDALLLKYLCELETYVIEMALPDDVRRRIRQAIRAEIRACLP